MIFLLELLDTTLGRICALTFHTHGCFVYAKWVNSAWGRRFMDYLWGKRQGA
jgi:hypothetical protein